MSRRNLNRTPAAVHDLDAIWDFIAQDSEAAADRVIDELALHFELLLQFPEIGELQPSLADGKYRRSVVRNFVVYYRPELNGITLARVLHGARDHEQLL